MFYSRITSGFHGFYITVLCIPFPFFCNVVNFEGAYISGFRFFFVCSFGRLFVYEIWFSFRFVSSVCSALNWFCVQYVYLFGCVIVALLMAQIDRFRVIKQWGKRNDERSLFVCGAKKRSCFYDNMVGTSK